MSAIKFHSMPLRRELLLRGAVDAPLHKLFRAAGRPVIVPMELEFAVTYKCANFCRTCSCMKNYTPGELSLDEYAAIFERMDFEPFSLSFTGGEPFFREDIFDIVSTACDRLNPTLVNIRTAADLPNRIHDIMRRLAIKHPSVFFIAWLSMDGSGRDLDRMRGSAGGSFESLLETFSFLNSVGAPNLRTGISILVSSVNAQKAPLLIASAFEMYPDFVSLGFATGSAVLSADPGKTEPVAGDVDKAHRIYDERMKTIKGGPVERAIHALLVMRSEAASASAAGRRNVSGCYAGFSYLYIDPHGAVATCPGKNLPLGDLRASDLRLTKIIDSDTAAVARREAKKLVCCCSSEGPMFSNIITTLPGLARTAVAAL